jgi:hypothetical protein
MSKLASLLILSIASVPAFADFNLLPEPESLSLFAIGGVGMLLARHRKSK